jgi:trigger factor
MNITKENIDELNAVLKIRLDEDDYTERVENVLKDYRKTATMPGFRPGKVPAGLIKKIYGTSVLVEEINKLVSESISKYLVDEKLNILGEPLPNKDMNTSFDWENQKEFEFAFDLGLSPVLEFTISQKDKVPFYNIQVDDKMIKSTKENYAQRLGTMEPVEKIEGNELLKGHLMQVDESGNEMEEGIKTEDSTMSLDVMKDEKIKESFHGRIVGDIVVLDMKKAYPNDTELASVLKIDKEHVPSISPHFKFTINEIFRFKKAEINQELYDKLYGKDKVKTEEEFTEKIVDELKHSLLHDSEYRFKLDAKEMLLKKAQFDLPVEFLKRWLMEANKDKITEDKLEEEFPAFEENLKWQLIQDKLIKENNLEVKDEELKGFARDYAMMQFRQYGLSEVPEENLKRYAEDILGNEEEKKRIYEKLYEDKVFDHVRETVKVEEKKVSGEKFNKLFEK